MSKIFGKFESYEVNRDLPEFQHQDYSEHGSTAVLRWDSFQLEAFPEKTINQVAAI